MKRDYKHVHKINNAFLHIFNTIKAKLSLSCPYKHFFNVINLFILISCYEIIKLKNIN
jgi:hypothetical protein